MKPSITNWYRFGYRGIWFNLALLLFSALIGQFLFQPFADVILDKQVNRIASVAFVVAVLLETVFFPLKLRDIIRFHKRDFASEEHKNEGAIVFSILLFGAIPAFLALNYAFQGMGMDPLENENIPGLIGLFITLRFLVFLGMTSVGGAGTVKNPASEGRAMLLDFAVVVYSSLYYVSLWQVMMLAPADFSPYLDNPTYMVFMLIGYALLALFWLVPIRAPYILEEWWSHPTRKGVYGLVGSLGLLVLFSLFQLLGPLLFTD